MIYLNLQDKWMYNIIKDDTLGIQYSVRLQIITMYRIPREFQIVG